MKLCLPIWCCSSMSIAGDFFVSKNVCAGVTALSHRMIDRQTQPECTFIMQCGFRRVTSIICGIKCCDQGTVWKNHSRAMLTTFVPFGRSVLMNSRVLAGAQQEICSSSPMVLDPAIPIFVLAQVTSSSTGCEVRWVASFVTDIACTRDSYCFARSY